MSFSAEMKDFLGGFQAGSQAAGAAKDLQARLEELEMKKEAFKAGQYEALLGPEPAKAGKVKKVTAASPNVDVDPEEADAYDDPELMYEPPAAVETPEDTSGFRIGGVKLFAEGGKVTPTRASSLPRKKRQRREDGTLDPLVGYVGDNDEIISATEAIPSQVTSPSNPEPSLISQGRGQPGNPPPPEGTTPSQGGGIRGLFQSAEDAIKAAMTGFAQSHNEQGAVGAEPDIDYVTGKGAATMEDIKAMDAKINPNGEISPWDMGRARLGEAYNYFVSQGQPQKAQRIAQQLLLYEKMASQTRGTLAMQMFGQGQNVEGLQMLVDAYNENIPNGNKMTAQITGTDGVTYEVVDEDGNPVEQATVPVQAAAEMAGNVANGSVFTEAAADIASKDELAAAAPAAQAPAEEPAAPAPAEAIPTSAPAAAPAATAPAPDPAAAAPAPAATVEGVTNAGAIPAPTEPAAAAPAAPATPAETAPAAPAEPEQQSISLAAGKKKGTREWARAQYIDAARVVDWYMSQDDDSPEHKAKLSKARRNLETARDNAFEWNRRSFMHTNAGKKGTRADADKDASYFEQELEKWRTQAADYALDAEPYFGPPKSAPATGGAIPTEVTPQSNLRAPSEAELADAKKLLASGIARDTIIEHMRAKGISTEGL